MSKKTDNFIEQYRTAIGVALKLPTTDKAVGEWGYTTELTAIINQRIKRLKAGRELHRQYLSDWLAGKKINRDGMGLATTAALAVGLGLSDDMGEAYALLALIVGGVWNPEKMSIKDARAALAVFKGGPASTKVDIDYERVGRIVDTAVQAAITRLSPPTLPPVVLALRDAAGTDDVGDCARKLFSDAVAARLTEIFEGKGEPVSSGDWPAVAMLLTEITCESWSVDRVRELVRTAVGQPGQVPGHQASSSL